jgi:ribosomal protein S18 acetylase RimI-like enzyme
MIRPIAADDVAALKSVIEATGLFPSDMLDSMIAPYLLGNEAGEIWLTYIGDAPEALVYCAPERMTDGAWNMLLIAVDPAVQGRGRGSALTDRVEAELTGQGARVLIVETSGLPEFQATRQFYLGKGYVEEARIRDFYQKGEDKVVFWKALG